MYMYIQQYTFIYMYEYTFIHMYVIHTYVYFGMLNLSRYYNGNNTVATDIFLNCYAFNDFTMYIIHCYTILIIY